MMTQGRKWLIPLIHCLLFSVITAVSCCARANEFRISPSRCVALHEGQACYAKVKFKWQLDEPKAVCVVRNDANIKLHCWSVNSAGVIEIELESESSISFSLIDEATGINLESAELEVVWVYKANNRRQSHWRIF
jgi:hypothetical protein